MVHSWGDGRFSPGGPPVPAPAGASAGLAPLAPDPAGEAPEKIAGAVFLKANQHTGRFLVRPETGLGEGLLITGHNPGNPAAEDTWGPLPLDFFGP